MAAWSIQMLFSTFMWLRSGQFWCLWRNSTIYIGQSDKRSIWIKSKQSDVDSIDAVATARIKILYFTTWQRLRKRLVGKESTLKMKFASLQLFIVDLIHGGINAFCKLLFLFLFVVLLLCSLLSFPLNNEFFLNIKTILFK